MSFRTRNSIKNIVFSEISYVVILLLQFMNRSVFIHFLPEEYLGMNGLFSNVLSFLSLAELGVGSAINFALYKPLKEGDVEALKSLMSLYRHLYKAVGVIVFILGSILMPFLPLLIKDLNSDIKYIYLYFMLYLFNSGISYFYTYKRSLIICDQKEYISTVATTISSIVLKVMQIAVLIVFESYAAYLSVMVAATIAENLIISAVADKMYPYLKDKNNKELDPKVLSEIKKNVFALIFHRIGEIIVYATDNIIISKFIGLVSVGLYSNYTLIIQAVKTVTNRFFNAITASLGNLVAFDDKEYVEKMLYNILFINAWIFSFCSISLLCLLQPFIKLWLGEKFLLSDSTVVIIVINFYLTGMRSTVLMFRNATGIFWYDRYKPIAEGAINLIMSVPLALRYGIAGTLSGTIISTLSVPFWVEPYILFKYYFNKKFYGFMLRQLKYLIMTIGISALTYLLCITARFSPLMTLTARIMLCVFVPNVCMSIIFRKDDSYVYFKSSIARIFMKLRDF